MLTITAEGQPGDDLGVVCQEAVDLATRLNCFVRIRLNDVQGLATPNGSAVRMMATHRRVLERRRTGEIGPDGGVAVS